MEYIKLIDACIKIGSGATPSGGKDAYKGGGYKLVRSQNVLDLKFSWDGLAEINEQQAQKLKNVELYAGDVLLNITGDSVARTCIVPEEILPARVNQHVAILRPKERVLDSYYLLYYLQLIKQYLLALANAGGTRNALTKKDIEEIKIPTPSFETQKKIASILSNYDTLIDINTKRIKILEESARELYKEWFVRMRFPGHEKTKFVKGIPEGWEYMRIDEYYKTGSGGTPSSSHKEYYDDGSINWVRTGELKDCFIFQSEIKITEQGLKNSSAKMYPRHSVILAMYGNSIGQLGILTQPSSTNQACCVLQPKTTEYSWEFLYLSLMEYRPYLISFGFGAAQQNISQDEIKKFKILFPDNKIVQMFTNIVTSIYGEIETLQLHNQELTATRDRLLPRLLSGELKVGA